MPDRQRKHRNKHHERRQHDAPPTEEGAERLQKVLAHAGVGSRRACEELILQGRVTVNGAVVRTLGTRVDARQSQIAVDGQVVRHERPVYFALWKPKGYVSTNRDPAGRPRVVDLLPEIPERVYCVGRLDEASAGLMLLTNDGALAHRLAHPRFGVEKVYRVLVAGTPAREVLDKITEGIWLAEGKVRARRVKVVGRRGEATLLEMVLAEGKNREIRRALARLGHKVMALLRVSVGPIRLKGLKPGQARPLSAHEIDLLRKTAAGLPIPSEEPRHNRKERRPHSSGRPQGHSGAHGSGGPRSAGGAHTSGAASSPGGAHSRGGARRPGGPPARKGHAPPRPHGPGAARRPAPVDPGPPVLGIPPSQRKGKPPATPELPPRRIIGMPPTPPADGPRNRGKTGAEHTPPPPRRRPRLPRRKPPTS